MRQHHVSGGNPQQSMSERVCRALAAAEGSTDWQHFKPAFKAVLAELREPSLDMLVAATGDLPDFGYLPEEWKAMIDHLDNEAMP